MKKIISLLVSLTLILSIVPMTVMAEDTGWDGVTTEAPTGSGTSADPYEIANAAQLAYVRDWVNAGTNRDQYYELTADIDLNNQEWEPIGLAYSNSTSFNGKFYGNGHTVKNMKITTYRSYNGFFGDVFAATITELGIENMNIEVSGGGGSHGVMAGRATGTFTDCYTKNSSVRNVDTGEKYEAVGGFIGTIRTTSTFTNCYAYNIAITGTYRSSQSGFAGRQENVYPSVLTNCYAAKITFNPLVEGNGAAYYGFGRKKSDDDTITAVNCWSTVTSAAGRSEVSDGYRYNPDWVLGTDGATKEGLITALVTDGGSYIVDDDVNDGYPCLDYEKPALVAATEYAGGSGSLTDPYQIATAEQLMYARDMINSKEHKDKCFILTADIDLEGSEWIPIGLDDTNHFAGTFDGDNHIVSNYTITGTNNGYIGFFGHVNGATIKNLGIENMTINITVDSGNIGGMIGRGKATVSNCFVRNSSILAPNRRHSSIGGFVSTVRTASSYTDCYVYNCTMTKSDCGRIVGFAANIENAETSTFENCYVGKVTIGTSNKASVYPFGCNEKAVEQNVKNCYSDLASASGTDTRYPYNADYAFGTYTAVKTDITDAFAAVESYKLDDAINDGYPSLANETVPVVVTPNPYVIAAVNTNGMVKVSILENSAVTGANVYVASYDGDGRLLGADILPATVGTQTSTVDATGATTIKVFVWNPNQMPLANMYSK